MKRLLRSAKSKHKGPGGRAVYLIGRSMGPEGCVVRFRRIDQELRLGFEGVKRFVPDESVERSKHFAAIAKLYTLASGKKIDYSLVRDGFRDIVEEAYGQPLTDLISKQALDAPNQWSRQWLPAIFNRETEAAQVVMWWPPNKSVFVPAIYCKDATTAHFVNLLLCRLFSGERPCVGCGVMFTPSRGNKVYHDFACAARHRMRRSRGRKIRRAKGEIR